MKPDWGRQQQEEMMRRQQEQMRRQQQEQVKRQQDLLRRQQMGYYYQQKQKQKRGHQPIQSLEQDPSLSSNPKLTARFLQLANDVTELRQQLSAKNLTIEEVQEKLISLAIQDDDGVWWSMGFQSGDWYRYEGDQWIRAGVPSALQSILNSGSHKARK